MAETKAEFLIETDIIVDYLSGGNSAEFLQQLMTEGTCFTSVLNVAELYLLCKTDEEKNAVRDGLNALHILGIPARYGLYTGKFVSLFTDIRDHLFCVLAWKANLTIVTNDINKYRNTGLKIYNKV